MCNTFAVCFLELYLYSHFHVLSPYRKYKIQNQGVLQSPYIPSNSLCMLVHCVRRSSIALVKWLFTFDLLLVCNTSQPEDTIFFSLVKDKETEVSCIYVCISIRSDTSIYTTQNVATFCNYLILMLYKQLHMLWLLLFDRIHMIPWHWH